MSRDVISRLSRDRDGVISLVGRVCACARARASVSDRLSDWVSDWVSGEVGLSE